ncbi:MAG: hypothetical protein QF704_09355, partial [Anaerolineales bacterium]|nr:hypothetical protein [Anaerolineales bacterium]
RAGRSNAQEFAFGLSTNPENSDDPNTMTFRFHFVADHQNNLGVSLYNGTTLLSTTTPYQEGSRYAISYYQEAGSGIVKWYRSPYSADSNSGFATLATATVSPNLTLKADIKMKDDDYLDMKYAISYFLFSPIADDFHADFPE